MKRVGKYTIQFEQNPSILSSASVGCKKEFEGPLGEHFDYCFDDSYAGEDSWEKAESRLQTEAVTRAIQKAGLKPENIDVIFSGDLLNQCIASTFGLRNLNIPFLGQYGACSTMAQTLLNSAIFTESGAANIAVAVTSSHFCSAERQFRNPIEYGGQRPPSAQWTASGSGAAVVSCQKKGDPVIVAGTIGRIVDLNITDANNMGAAMAPAAAETIKNYLEDTGNKPSNFDLILTGDLGRIGSDLLIELLRRHDIDISSVHDDCGLMLYDREKQDVHAGGSGCGCSATVLNSYIMQEMLKGNLKRILFVGTGALMSPTSSAQGESIPSIAHAVEIARRK